MIVHATDVFSPRVGGIETQVTGLAQAQASAGRDVRVLTTAPAQVTVDGRPFPVYRLPGGIGSAAVRPFARQRVWDLLDELGPDIVHAHVSAVSPCAWYAVHWALRHDRPVVASVHSLWGGLVGVLHRVLDQPTGWITRAVLAPVSHAAATRVRRAVPEAEVLVVPNGIDPAGWRRPASSDRTDGIHVVSVGRLVGRRRPLTALEVLRAARERVGPRLRATIAGSGPAASRLAEYLRRHRMTGWVRLIGQLDPSAVRVLLHQADIYLNAAALESFGIAALEARTAGVPVVALAGTGTADFVRHEREGLLCHGVGGLADAVVRLATDDRLRKAIAEHNTLHAPDCTWPQVLAAFERCYSHAADRIQHSTQPADRRALLH